MSELFFCEMCEKTSNDIKRELFIEDGQISRIYDFCPSCWYEVYSRLLKDFMENNEYKVTGYMRNIIDALTAEKANDKKIDMIVKILGRSELTMDDLHPSSIRICKSTIVGDDKCGNESDDCSEEECNCGCGQEECENN